MSREEYDQELERATSPEERERAEEEKWWSFWFYDQQLRWEEIQKQQYDAN